MNEFDAPPPKLKIPEEQKPWWVVALVATIIILLLYTGFFMYLLSISDQQMNQDSNSQIQSIPTKVSH